MPRKVAKKKAGRVTRKPIRTLKATAARGGSKQKMGSGLTLMSEAQAKSLGRQKLINSYARDEARLGERQGRAARSVEAKYAKTAAGKAHAKKRALLNKGVQSGPLGGTLYGTEGYEKSYRGKVKSKK